LNDSHATGAAVGLVAGFHARASWLSLLVANKPHKCSAALRGSDGRKALGQVFADAHARGAFNVTDSPATRVTHSTGREHTQHLRQAANVTRQAHRLPSCTARARWPRLGG